MGSSGEGHARPDMQNLCRDGLGFCGRIAAVGGMFVLGFYLIAVQSTNWSETTNLAMGDGLESVGEAQFGLSRYCLKTRVEAFQGDFFTCHQYEDILSIRTLNGSWFNETGCKRFEGVCDANEQVRAALVFSVLFLFVGAVWSEKVHINGLMVSVSAGGGAFAMFAWVVFQNGLESGEGLSAGPGLGLVAGGFVLALLCAVGTCIDCMVINKAETLDICNDGINWHGRLGSALTVITWVFILVGVSETNWTSTNDLGKAGGLCNDKAILDFTGNSSIAPCAGNVAEFALMQYCVESAVELYGYQKKSVCMDYSEEITVIMTNVTKTGWERFSNFGLEIKSTACLFSGVIAIGCAGFADMFSEKLLLCAILMCLASLAGICAMSAWLTFQTELDGELNEASTTGSGLFWIMGSWMVAAVGSILYCTDYRNYSRQGNATIEHSSSEEKKENENEKRDDESSI